MHRDGIARDRPVVGGRNDGRIALVVGFTSPRVPTVVGGRRSTTGHRLVERDAYVNEGAIPPGATPTRSLSASTKVAEKILVTENVCEKKAAWWLRNETLQRGEAIEVVPPLTTFIVRRRVRCRREATS